MQILSIQLKNVRAIKDATLLLGHVTCFVGKAPENIKNLREACGFMAAVATGREVEWLAQEKLQWDDFLNKQDSEARPEFTVEAELSDSKFVRWHCVYDIEKHARLEETFQVLENPAFTEGTPVLLAEAEKNKNFQAFQGLLSVFVKPEEHSYDIFVDPVKRWPFLSRLTIEVDRMDEKARRGLLNAMQPFFPGIERLGVRYWKDGDKSFFYVVDGVRIGERAMANEDRKVMDVMMGCLSEDDVILLRNVDNCQLEERYPVIAEYLAKAKKQIIVTTQNPAFARRLACACVYEVFREEGGVLKVLPLESAKAEIQKETNVVSPH